MSVVPSETPVPYLIMSKDKDLLYEFQAYLKNDDVFSFIEKYNNHIGGKKIKSSDKGSVRIFDPSLFTKLEHCFNFGGNNSSVRNSSYIEITFVDPGNDMDDFFMGDLFSVSAIDVTPLVFPDRDKIAKYNALEESKIFSDSENLREDILDVRDTVAEDLNTAGAKDLYWISYGIGGRRADWASPMFCIKNQAVWDTNGTDGKKVRLRFTPQDASVYRSSDEINNADRDYLEDQSDTMHFGSDEYVKIVDAKIDFAGEEVWSNYRPIVNALYKLINKTFKELFFNKSKERKNILLFLPNYEELFKKKWSIAIKDAYTERLGTPNPELGLGSWEMVEEVAISIGDFFTRVEDSKKKQIAILIMEKFFVGLPIKFMSQKVKKEVLKGTSVFVDKTIYDTTKNNIKDAYKFADGDKSFYILTELTNFLDPQKDFKNFLLQLHKGASVPDGHSIPNYVFLDENDVSVISHTIPNLDTKYRLFGEENPIIENGKGVITLVGENSLIYKYFYLRDLKSRLPSFFGGKIPTTEDVTKDLGREYVKLGFTTEYYKALSERLKSEYSSGKPSVFGDFYVVPQSPVDIETTKDVLEFLKLKDKSLYGAIRDNKVPVFSLGLTKSNVLALSFDLNKVYSSIWLNNYGFDKKYFVMRGLFGKDEINKDKTVVFEKLVEAFKKGKKAEVKSLIYAMLDEDPTFFWDTGFIANALGFESQHSNALDQNKVVVAGFGGGGVGGWEDGDGSRTDSAYIDYASTYGVVLTEKDVEDVTRFGSKQNDRSVVGLIERKQKENKVNFIYDIIEKLVGLLNSEYADVEFSPDTRPVDHTKLVKDMMDFIMDNCLTGKIKAVPMFSLSSQITTIMYPCLLLGVEPAGLFGNVKTIINRNRTWFNGIFVISGFRHLISGNDVYSEFGLVKTSKSP